MTTYTKINKETSTYTKRDKKDIERGWFRGGWFTQSWFAGAYVKVIKDLSTYSKIEKE